MEIAMIVRENNSDLIVGLIGFIKLLYRSLAKARDDFVKQNHFLKNLIIFSATSSKTLKLSE
jgi:hypothetical protein